jgi:integrase
MEKDKYKMLGHAYKKEVPPTRPEILGALCQLPVLRDRALLSFLYLTGCRISEVVRYKHRSKDWKGEPIKKDQVEIQSDFIIIHNVRVLKTRKEIRFKKVPIRVNSLEHPFINQFLEYFNKISDPNAYLFDITRQRAFQILKTVGIFPHLLRHTRVTHLISDYDFSVPQLQKFFGWIKWDSAGEYAHLDIRDIMKKLELK